MIKVYTGPMYAAKSLGLIQAAKVRQKQGINNVVCLKPSKDTRDMGDHLNYHGAYKVSAYLGKYLSKLKILEDHRGNDYYSSWDSALKPYQDEVKKANP